VVRGGNFRGIEGRRGAVRGSAMDYRAVGEDVKQDIADSAEPITCPVLILWGEDFDVN
jgi:hypothetical protein